MSVTLVGLVAMVLGTLGTFGCGISLLEKSIDTFSDGGYRIGANTVLPLNRPLLIWTTGVAIADLATSASLLVVGFFALRQSNTARKWAIGISIAIIALAMTKLVASIGYFREMQIDIRHAELAVLTSEQKKNVPADIDEQIRRMSIVLPIAIFILQSLAPLLILLVWTRKDVRQAFVKPA